MKPNKQLDATARKLRHALLLLSGAMLVHLTICAIGLGGISLRTYICDFLNGPQFLHFFLANAPYRWPHLWFLGALVYIYLFALLWFGDGSRLQTADPLGAVFLACMAAFQEFARWLPFNPVLPISGIQIPFFVLFIFRGLPFFLLGIWLRSRKSDNRSLRIPLFAATALVVVGAILAVLEAHWTVNSQFYIGNYLMVSGMFLWAIQNPSSGSNPLAFIGKNLSMPVYIVHPTVARWVGSILHHAGVEPTPLVNWTRPLFVIFCSIVLAGSFHVAMEQLRFWSRRQ